LKENKNEMKEVEGREGRKKNCGMFFSFIFSSFFLLSFLLSSFTNFNGSS